MALSRKRELVTLLRSMLTGLVATAADFSVLALAVGVLGLSARLANLPSLLAGSLVQFIGNRHFAFKARAGCVKRQMRWFALSEAVALSTNALLYELVAQRVSLNALTAVLLRAATCTVVFLCWSYPVWRKVFAVRARAARAPDANQRAHEV